MEIRKYEKYKFIVLASLIFLIGFVSGSGENLVEPSGFGFDNLDGPTLVPSINYSELPTVNASDLWITDIGSLGTVNATQHSNEGGVLNILESWVDSLWCSLSGCTMEGDIDMDQNNIFDIDSMTLTNQINITNNWSDAENSQLNIENVNPTGFAGTRLVNNDGDQAFRGLFSRTLSSALFPAVVGENESVSGITSVGGPIFIVTTSNHSVYIGGGPDDSLLNTDFFLRVNPVLQSLEIQGNKLIRPVETDGVETMVFESNVGAAEGELTFMFVGSDSNNNSVVQSVKQIGKNNSASIQGQNSQIVASKDYLTMPAAVQAQFENNTGDPIIEEWFSNITNCLIYEDYLQGLGLLDEGLQQVCDTVGRIVPQSILGDVDVVRSLTSHEALTAFNSFDFIGRNGNDAGFFFNGDAGGKVHIRDSRQVLANITDFTDVICNFDDATLCDFVSESIAPEIGRDWDSVLEDECHDNRCANAKGGNEKIMSVNSSTLGATNINLTFWLTTSFVTLDSLEVEVDDNLGNSTVVFTETALIVDDLINISLSSTYWNKTNVTISFILNGANINRQAWVDEVILSSTLNPSVLINESYEGGYLVLGEDRGTTLSCGMKVIKEANNDTFGTEWVMQLGCPDGRTEILGNASFVDVTIENQTIVGNQLITGNLTVEGTISQNGTLIDDLYLQLDGGNSPTSNIDWGGKNLTNVNIGIMDQLLLGGFYTSPYTLSVQTNTSSTWMEILNSAGADKGAFFGMTGSGVDGDTFALYNWQGGPINFYTDTTSQSGVLRLSIGNDGTFGFENNALSNVKNITDVDIIEMDTGGITGVNDITGTNGGYLTGFRSASFGAVDRGEGLNLTGRNGPGTDTGGTLNWHSNDAYVGTFSIDSNDRLGIYNSTIVDENTVPNAWIDFNGNVEFVNITSTIDSWCNSTNCYTLAELLNNTVGGGGGGDSGGWVNDSTNTNTSLDVNIAGSINQSDNISTNTVYNMYTTVLNKVNGVGAVGLGTSYLTRLMDSDGGIEDAGLYSFRWLNAGLHTASSQYNLQTIENDELVNKLIINSTGFYINESLCLAGDSSCYASLSASFQEEIGSNCGTDNYVYGVANNGVLQCRVDKNCVDNGVNGECFGETCALTVEDGCVTSIGVPETPYLYDWNGTFLRKVAHNLLELKGVSMIPLVNYTETSNFSFTIANWREEVEYFDYIRLNQRCHLGNKMRYKSYYSNVAELGKDNEQYLFLVQNDSGSFRFENITIPAVCLGADFINYQLEIGGYYEEI